ncbi:hypothetical protein RBWH47_02236 [Rhodopirellula baltica WH47]|uniref:Uncharacterized protein n=1 Tax=Rhodopirellula baltica WH47 TaxID=991778 RepID=F2AKB7_RHOBT|nr:hypothetical protein RBWH47_02236 [Rhodopirellula baltica WH47]
MTARVNVIRSENPTEFCRHPRGLFVAIALTPSIWFVHSHHKIPSRFHQAIQIHD